ncbi:MAG: choice-of-anchor Q domain-containing protein [Vicinamibacterales bacterium]
MSYTFTGGRAVAGAGLGGGILLTRSSPELRYNVIRGNFATKGGGVAIVNSNPVLLQNVIAGNTATSGSGGIDVNVGRLVIAGNTVDANVSGGPAGGMAIFAAYSALLVNNTVTRNTANDPAGGGGVAVWFSAARIVNTTVAGNRGGGLLVRGAQLAPVEIVNSVLWGNEGPAGESWGYDLTSGKGDFSVRYSAVGPSPVWDVRILESPGNITADPALMDLRGGNVHLCDGSPAIDAGTTDGLEGLPETDKDGRPRIMGTGIDMGAYEAGDALQDRTPPVITPMVTGTIGDNGWYTGDVSVEWAVSDKESAVTERSGCEALLVDYDTSGVSFTCSATSGGGTASATVLVKRDATPPVFTSCTITPATLWPPNRQMVAVSASVSASDMSGASILLAQARSSEPDLGPQPGDRPGDIEGFVPGGLITQGALRAERLAGGRGRSYLLVYSVRDGAGNEGVPCRLTVTVPQNAADTAGKK